MISSLFDLFRELFSNNERRKKRLNWLTKIFIAFIILVVGICLITIVKLMEEIYIDKMEIKKYKEEITKIHELEIQCKVLQDTNQLLTDIMSKQNPETKDILKHKEEMKKFKNKE